MTARPRVALLVGLLSFLFGCKRAPAGADFTTADGHASYRGALLEGSDARTFEALGDHYAKDAVHVWFCDTYRSSQDYFTTKRNRVVEMTGADPATFRALSQGYARDARNAYHDGERFVVEHVDSFEVLDYGFARDRVTGYYHQTRVPGSHGPTFIVLDPHYARDRASVFYTDLETGRDGRPPVPRSVRIAGAQPETFTVVEGGYATDAGHAYFDGTPLTTDVATFRALSIEYAKTATQVFYREGVIAGADAGTFEVLEIPADGVNARDRTGTYHDGRRTGAPSAAKSRAGTPSAER